MKKLKLLIAAAAVCGAYAAYACNNNVTFTCWNDNDELDWTSPYNLGLSACTTATHIIATETVTFPVSTSTSFGIGHDDGIKELICEGDAEIYDNCGFFYHTLTAVSNAGTWHIPVNPYGSCDNRL